MIRIEITDKMQAWAEKKTDAHKKGKRFDENMNLRNSVLMGYLGDACFWKHFPMAKHIDNSVCDFELVEKQIDNKTYWSGCVPRDEFFVQIPKEDADRGTGNYFFICYNEADKICWLLGWKPCKEYLDHSTYREAGETRKFPTTITYKASCYEYPISMLNDPKLLIQTHDVSRMDCPKCGHQIVYVKNNRGQKMAINSETWRDGEEIFVYGKHKIHLPWCHKGKGKA